MAKRIEKRTSMTAEMTCLMRALSYRDRSSIYRSNDYIAPLLISSFLNTLAKTSIFRNIYKYLAPKGIYEYIIARTKYIDEVFEKYKQDIGQVVLLGAGFDSRSIRFNDQLKHAAFFELDSPITQESKLARLKEKKIKIPANINYIPINFNKETIMEKLTEYGFLRDRVSLFLLEGLTMYLNEKSIDATFNMIYDIAARGSMVVFDYVYSSVIRRENTYRDEGKISNMVGAFGEKWSFGIEKGDINHFLSKYGFTLTDEANSTALEKRYFTNIKGNLIHHVNGTHCIVTAKK